MHRLNTLALATMLSAKFTAQQNCERRGGMGPTSCTVEQNKLTKVSSARGACAATYTLAATSPSGGALKDVPQFRNKLMFAGYPSNANIAFAASGTTVTITSPLDLLDDGTAPAAGAINACTRISNANLTGRACTCGGAAGKYGMSVWNRQTYSCNA
jgi:hypothetical protein